jgi:SNF2 family DNA or RNA helicase
MINRRARNRAGGSAERVPAIHPDVVREFVDRPRNDYEWMKSMPSRVLSDELEAIGIGRDPDYPWKKHQKVSLLIGAALERTALWLDMGLGKSRVALRLVRYFRERGELTGCLIGAISEAAVVAWEDELAKWEPDMPVVVLRKGLSSEAKWRLLEGFQGGVILGSYGGIRAMVTDIKPKPKGKKSGQFINESKARRLAKLIQCCVADESTELANQDSRLSQVFYRFSKCRFFYELAGVPTGRDPTVLWRQMYLLDKGETLGDTLGLFRAAFFEEKDNYWGGKEYTFDKTKDARLRQILRHRSITYDEAECTDLPQVVAKVEHIQLPQEAKGYYRRFLRELKASRGGIVERNGIFVRMRQLTSGYIGVTEEAVDDEGRVAGEKVDFDLAYNPKIDRLIELVATVPKGRKFVIWHEYTHTGDTIAARLREAKVKFQRLDGRTTKDARAIQTRFDRDEGCVGLLINHWVGAFSLNLQRANYEFIVEAPVSYIRDRQMRKRLPRTGQTRTVFRYDLVCPGTVDERILQFHAEGRDMFKALIRDPMDVIPEDW